MIIGTIRILPSPGRRGEVLEVLRAIQGPVLAQPGCCSCRVYEEAGAKPAVVLFERWQTEAAFETHLRSEAYRRILGALELSGSPPEICFDHVSQSEGIERIERARSQDAGHPPDRTDPTSNPEGVPSKSRGGPA